MGFFEVIVSDGSVGEECGDVRLHHDAIVKNGDAGWIIVLPIHFRRLLYEVIDLVSNGKTIERHHINYQVNNCKISIAKQQSPIVNTARRAH